MTNYAGPAQQTSAGSRPGLPVSAAARSCSWVLVRRASGVRVRLPTVQQNVQQADPVQTAAARQRRECRQQREGRSAAASEKDCMYSAATEGR